MLIRINKLLSNYGVCSRREADRLTEEGRITADGSTVHTGQRVENDAYICIDGEPIKRENEKVLLAYNKPVGVVCTTTNRYNERNIIDEIGYDKRIYPIGRLDKNSCGLILLTNDGDTAKRLMCAGEGHEKEYIVKINKPVSQDILEKLRNGIYLDDLKKTTAKCRAEAYFPKHKKDNRQTHYFSIILIQGLNRQIRRMCAACGVKVVFLQRVRIMNINLGNLKEGKYREIQGEEYKIFCNQLLSTQS